MTIKISTITIIALIVIIKSAIRLIIFTLDLNLVCFIISNYFFIIWDLVFR